MSSSYVQPSHVDTITFAVVPIEFMVACDSILGAVQEALQNNTHPEHGPDYGLLPPYCNGAKGILRGNYTWPLVFDRNSPLCKEVFMTELMARIWFERSPLFNQHRNALEVYLKPPISFRANHVSVDSDGLVANRDSVIGLQQRPPPVYLNSTLSIDDLCSKEHINAYQGFLTALVWLENSPRERMIMGSRSPSDVFAYNPPACRW